MNTFVIPASFAGFVLRADRCASLRFVTERELSAADAGDLTRHFHSAGTLAFRESPFSDKELRDLPDVRIERADKTPAQRLRAVLAVVAQQMGVPVDAFYLAEMERIIQHYKDKLE
jgi:hypothetical protein